MFLGSLFRVLCFLSKVNELVKIQFHDGVFLDKVYSERSSYAPPSTSSSISTTRTIHVFADLDEEFTESMNELASMY